MKKLCGSGKVRRLLSCALFLFLLAAVFTGTTNLFRNAGINRKNLTGLKEEDALDIVYVGGSTAYVYWEPLKAWKDCGITSYSYAHDSVQMEALQYYMEEVLKTQDPELIILDIRCFLNDNTQLNESGIRNGTDSLDWYSPTRWKLVYTYLNNRELPEDTDILSYYLDIAKYHTASSSLGNELKWEFLDNSWENDLKGWMFVDNYQYLEAPGALTQEKTVLDEGTERTVERLLDYCDSIDTEVLFVLAPYYITDSDMRIYNAMEEMITERGYPCVNTNEYYDEMGLDFHTDLYNVNHVNMFGADKFTDFMEAYLAAHYDLPDHRGEEGYEDWDACYEAFHEEELVYKASITERIEERVAAFETEELLPSLTDAAEWSVYAQNDYFVKLVVWEESAGQEDGMQEDMSDVPVSGSSSETADASVQSGTASAAAWDTILENLEITAGAGEVQLLAGNSTVGSEEILSETEYSAVLTKAGELGTSEIRLSAGGEDGASVLIDGTQYCPEGEGLHIVLYDHNRKTVVDAVTLTAGKDGKILLVR